MGNIVDNNFTFSLGSLTEYNLNMLFMVFTQLMGSVSSNRGKSLANNGLWWVDCLLGGELGELGDSLLLFLLLEAVARGGEFSSLSLKESLSLGAGEEFSSLLVASQSLGRFLFPFPLVDLAFGGVFLMRRIL